MPEAAARVAHINLARGFRGGERQTQLLIEELGRYGWRQRLVARRAEELARRCTTIDGLEIIETANRFSALGALGACDLVHVHEAGGTPAAWLNRLTRGTPYIITRRVQKGPRRNWINRRMYRGSTQVTSVSAAIADALQRFDPMVSCTPILSASGQLAADAARSAELRAAWGGDFIIGHVGALDDSHKGQRQILALARELREVEPGARFVLVGGGRDAEALHAEAASLPNVYFTGQVTDVGNYLGAFDAFIFPSRHEGLGSILLDALAFGLPVVATAVGGIPEVIEHGTNGMLCRPDDIAGMARALRDLQHDDSLRERISAANRLAAESHRPERMAARYHRLYERVLGTPARAPATS